MDAGGRNLAGGRRRNRSNPATPRAALNRTNQVSPESTIRTLQEAFDVSTRSVLTTFFVFLALGALSPVYAQEASGNAELIKWSILSAGFPLGIAAGLAAIGQGLSVGSAAEALARNPSAAGEIRGVLILGLVLIESLVIYVLLISLILFFLKPFGG